MRLLASKFTSTVLIVAILAAGGLLTWRHWHGGQPAMPVKAFSLYDLHGSVHHPSDWSGKVLLLNFWAPWCTPCRKEVPMLVQLQKQYGPQGLQVVGLSVDQPANVQAFIEKHPVNYPLLVGLNAIVTLEDAYGETRLPYSIIVDRAGHVRYRVLGELAHVRLLRRLRPLLKTK